MTEEKKVKLPHNIILENRKVLSISGVADVDAFDEQTVKVITGDGGLTVKGQELQIEKINIETGELLVKGRVDALIYTQTERYDGNFLSRLFR